MDLSSSSITVFGCGRMGSAFIDSLFHEISILKRGQVHVVGKTKVNADACLKGCIAYTGIDGCIEAAKESKVWILCVPPKEVLSLLDIIEKECAFPKIIISFVAGVSINILRSHIRSQDFLVRAMTSISIRYRNSIICVSFDKINERYDYYVNELLSKLGICLQIEDELMDTATIFCGSGLAFCLEIMDSIISTGVDLGFRRTEAQIMVGKTFMNAIDLLFKNKNCNEWINSIATPDGCTIEGLKKMKEEKLRETISNVIKRSFDKIRGK